MNDRVSAAVDGDWNLAAWRARIGAGRAFIMTCGAAAVLAALLLILTDRQRYRAEAMLAVARPGAVLAFDPRFAPAADNPTFPYRVNSLRVYSELLESEGMTVLVAQALTKAGYAESVDSGDLLSAVRFEALADGALLRIEAAGASPTSAALLAQTWAEVFSARMTELYGAAADAEVRAARDEATGSLTRAEADLAEGYVQSRLASRQAALAALRTAHADLLAARERLRAAKEDLVALRAASGAGSTARLGALQLAMAALTAGTVPSRTLGVQLNLGSGDEPFPTQLAAVSRQVDARLETLEKSLPDATTRLDGARRDLAIAEAAVEDLRRRRDLAAERYQTLVRKADELGVAAATQAPEVRLASPAVTSDQLPWGSYLLRLAAALGLGLILGLIWVMAVRPRAS